jgi:LysM repeat protein
MNRSNSGRSSTASTSGKGEFVLSLIGWIAALMIAGVALYFGWLAYRRQPLPVSLPDASAVQAVSLPAILPKKEPASAEPTGLPDLSAAGGFEFVPRRTLVHTTIPNRPVQDVREVKVEAGDSLFGIAGDGKIKPETVLWSNYETLNDNPDMISVGMKLKIPPVDGVYYKVEQGDTVQSVAARFSVKSDTILSWTANAIDLVEQKLEAGKYVMVPGGHREFRQWVIPTIPRSGAAAGVSKSVLGAGACEGNSSGANGSGSFIWPAPQHNVSGNGYGPSHLGIDIAAGDGSPVFAADSGVVVFAGWANGGYGNMVMIDHGNGYQTLYAHLAAVSTGCGASVGKGGTIGVAGSTGNSTGTHLHFEIRYLGGFINPWSNLPAP